MCIGIPVQVVQSGEFVSLCRSRNGEEQINMMLTGTQPEGTWLLAFLGSAREIISEEDARNIDKALDGLSAIMSQQEDFMVADYFPGLADT
ncbi:MAG: HypC/HybG/HupF family hydrogenase formation chaperone [Candidatus Thiodiazotropha sp. (ex Lucinoma kastoroae)]|nr:HypC/HybG/HupF family hydrogenase formation chaperone [Candidatus Thiodiazotropha sp. (ex Lucinoma kastoroae)]